MSEVWRKVSVPILFSGQRRCVFTFPSLRYPDISAVLAHGLRDCPEREWFRSMREENAPGIDAADADSVYSITQQLLTQHSVSRGKIWQYVSPSLSLKPRTTN